MALQTFFDDSCHGRRWKETGSIERKDGSGRPKGSKPTQNAMLEKLCLADRKASTAELTNGAKKVWRAITPEYLKNLYESMPRRMAAVIAAGGRHTKY